MTMTRIAKRALQVTALLVSVGCLVVSAVGLAGVLDDQPRPSPEVAAAANRVAVSESIDGDCPWGGGKAEAVDLVSRSSAEARSAA
jgi:hypothetical protein